ncbi:DUF2490 domain-containing protein [Hymenobacter sp. ISL-91]|uniref:DUF2490 domain-containing protein n=1 Tax=Hymenobacter sp. ISL-91 TaxID=2819151 RepID=UPI001BE6D19A|nr:DUF2490 domain-containing protein [Hymenobacter sp. ISL-91]MBT2558343.1 DUF2490 domain-containing protein [Hymenobacter sp. ISL-91]
MRTRCVLVLLLVLLSGLAYHARAQGPIRLPDYNTLGWATYSGDFRLADQWSLHTEYQLRRVELLGRQQQHLARTGLMRQLGERLEVSAGYTFLRTSSYGRYPNVTGRPQPEHRIYQDVTLTDALGRLHLEHRLRLEQRWIGQRADEGQGPVAGWQYQNRARYQLLAQVPLQGPTLGDQEWYLNGFGELFIGFGRNVGQNVFNQSRLSAGLGYQFGPNLQLELNYLNQISQHGSPEPVTGRPVFEYNRGLRLNAQLDVDFRRSR